MITFVGPLSAKTIGGNDFFATFTVGIFVIGTAICNIPSTALFNKYGRRGGFGIGCLCLILGGILCCISISSKHLGLLIFGSCILGFGVGMGQFYRFAAIDIASEEHKSWAVTTVLTGGCFAAFLGPTLGIATRDMFSQQYLGCYVIMVILGIVNLGTVMFVTFPPPITPDIALLPDLASLSASIGGTIRLSHDSTREKRDSDPEVLMHGLSGQSGADITAAAAVGGKGLTSPVSNDGAAAGRRSVSDSVPKARPLLGIVLSVGFIVPTLINTVSQVLMMIVMINCTLELNQLGYSFVYLSLVLDMHFFAMFASGFITGYMIKQYKCFNVCVAGTVLMGVAYIVFISGDHLANFFVGDIILGISWNMLFSSGTVMLSNCYEPIEQNAVQSVNEFIINSISGIFSIISGFILAEYGWENLLEACLAVYLITCAITVALCLYYKAYYGNINDYNVTYQSRPGSVNSNTSAHARVIKQAMNSEGQEVSSVLHQQQNEASVGKKNGVVGHAYSSDDELLKDNNHTIV